MPLYHKKVTQIIFLANNRSPFLQVPRSASKSEITLPKHRQIRLRAKLLNNRHTYRIWRQNYRITAPNLYNIGN